MSESRTEEQFAAPTEGAKCGWTGPSGEFVCVKPEGHTGNHRTVRVAMPNSPREMRPRAYFQGRGK